MYLSQIKNDSSNYKGLLLLFTFKEYNSFNSLAEIFSRFVDGFKSTQNDFALKCTLRYIIYTLNINLHSEVCLWIIQLKKSQR